MAESHELGVKATGPYAVTKDFKILPRALQNSVKMKLL